MANSELNSCTEFNYFLILSVYCADDC